MTAIAPPDLAYETVNDPAALRSALRELGRVWGWLNQFTDVAVEMPDFSVEEIRAAKITTTAVLSMLVGKATARLNALQAGQPRSDVVVLDPKQGQLVRPHSGVTVLPMVTRPAVATHGLSSAVVTLHAGGSSPPQVSVDDDTILVMIFGSVELVWLAAEDTEQCQTVLPHQHVFISGGVRYHLVNNGHLHATAVQVRATADISAGIHQAPELAFGPQGQSLPAAG